MSSCLDRLKIEKSTSGSKLSPLQYNYDGTLPKERKLSDALKKLNTTVKEARRHAELLRTKVLNTMIGTRRTFLMALLHY